MIWFRISRLISLDTFNQLGKASIMMLTSKETLLPLFGALRWSGFSPIRANTSTGSLSARPRASGKSPASPLTLRTVFCRFWSPAAARSVGDARLWFAYSPPDRWPSPSAMA
ncbi:hypothetical protein KCP69_00310 [Salmonella enterica subsp. enterica]|nr:hypothetical protein KCP69_00310 [Salmonella enterica subsp. enterica]